ncbi:hypothetical protein F5J12DRAFT_814704 [Pisolithus orientalis]|uniref:uncharacterized protein n=1 Tax=Pisolithus orientalis TaxID=936130 RepID=UPI0022256223|nr:uncharacterized protein F5J12DRAFT_814704 [Pisolithus orientalis]KAI6020003.1 hypothetical protein F5J12DRAFT_814704 [Pisolithus orientalis]
MSFLRSMWQRCFWRPYLVGKDLEGNRYFEFPNRGGDRPKRIIQYTSDDDMLAYVASGKRLPVQWSSWLTYTRRDAPTIEEVQADLAYRKRVQMNAARLEAKEKEERARLASQTAFQLSHALRAGIPKHVEPPLDPKKAQSDRREPDTKAYDPWATANKTPEAPQSWTPTARHR